MKNKNVIITNKRNKSRQISICFLLNLSIMKPVNIDTIRLREVEIAIILIKYQIL